MTDRAPRDCSETIPALLSEDLQWSMTHRKALVAMRPRLTTMR